jgi:hypothetical protein
MRPYAVLAPVEVGGVRIGMATLHNEEDLARKDVRVGDEVVVMRAGDVIPQVVGPAGDHLPGTKRFRMPKKCPLCGSDIVKPEGEVMHRCPNRACPSRGLESLINWVQAAADIEGVGEQFVQVVTGNTPRNFCVSLANQFFVLRSQCGKPSVNLALSATLYDFLFQLALRRRPDSHSRAVVKQNLQLQYVVDSFPRHLRMHAARVVPNHSAKRAMRVRRGVGPPRQSKFRRRIAQLIAHYARLYSRESLHRIDFQNVIEVPRPVHHNGRIAALPRQTCPAAARKDRHSKFSAYTDRRDYILNRLRNHNA